LDDAGANYAVYVEPPKAPGLVQVIPVLRRKVKAHFEADRAAADYSELAANGLKADRKTRSFVKCDRYSIEDDPVTELGTYYRLIATRDFEPIGYCTFSLRIADWGRCIVEMDEAWLEARYRKRGIGLEMAQLAGDITVQTLLELDRRMSSPVRLRQSLEVGVEADVYSTSGEAFLWDVASSIEIGLMEEEWTGLSVTSIECYPRW